MNITGVIKRINDTQEVSDKFKKREFVVTTKDGEYTQDIGMEFIQDSVGMLDQYKNGEIVSVEVNLKGRDWESPKDGSIRNFITLQAWKIDYAGEHADALSGAEQAKADTIKAQADDGLPF